MDIADLVVRDIYETNTDLHNDLISTRNLSMKNGVSLSMSVSVQRAIGMPTFLQGGILFYRDTDGAIAELFCPFDQTIDGLCFLPGASISARDLVSELLDGEKGEVDLSLSIALSLSVKRVDLNYDIDSEQLEATVMLGNQTRGVKIAVTEQLREFLVFSK